MTNWKDINPNFTEQLSCEWTGREFTFEQTQEWINNGLTPEDAAFASYLREKGYVAIMMINYDLVSLKRDYLNNLNKKGKGKASSDNDEEIEDRSFSSSDEEEEIIEETRMIDILSDFEKDLETRTKWWEKGISYEDARDWIKAGLMFDEENLAAYIIKEKGHRYAYSIPKSVLLEWKNEYEETEEYQLNRAIAMSLEEKKFQIQEPPKK